MHESVLLTMSRLQSSFERGPVRKVTIAFKAGIGWCYRTLRASTSYFQDLLQLFKYTKSVNSPKLLTNKTNYAPLIIISWGLQTSFKVLRIFSSHLVLLRQSISSNLKVLSEFSMLARHGYAN